MSFVLNLSRFAKMPLPKNWRKRRVVALAILNLILLTDELHRNFPILRLSLGILRCWKLLLRFSTITSLLRSPLLQTIFPFNPGQAQLLTHCFVPFVMKVTVFWPQAHSGVSHYLSYRSLERSQRLNLSQVDMDYTVIFTPRLTSLLLILHPSVKHFQPIVSRDLSMHMKQLLTSHASRPC